MSRKVIELVQVLVDRIHQGGYTQRALEDDIYAESQKRIAAEKDRDHWKQARQDAHEAGELMRAELEQLKSRHAALANEAADDKLEKLRLFAEFKAARAEIETLRGAMAADDQRLRDAEERIWPERTLGCDAPDAMADEILHLRQQLADAQRAVSDSFAEVNSVRQQLNAANAAETLQRAGIERQSVCIGKVRAAQNNYQWPASWNEITAALAELDGEPTPVAEPLDTEGGK